MSIRRYLECVCDECGVILRLETASIGLTDSGTITNGDLDMIQYNGWQRRAIAGSTLRTVDYCERCLSNEREARAKR